MTIPTTVHTAAIGVERHADSADNPTHALGRRHIHRRAAVKDARVQARIRTRRRLRGRVAPHKMRSAVSSHMSDGRQLCAACEARAVCGASRTVDAEQGAPEAEARQQPRADEGGRRADNQHDRHDGPIPAQMHDYARLRIHERACAAREELGGCNALARVRARTQRRSASAQRRSTFLQCISGTADGIPRGMVSRAATGYAACNSNSDRAG